MDVGFFVSLFRNSKERFYRKLEGVFNRYFDKIEPLYRAYEVELRKIYPDAEEGKLKELYILQSILNSVALCLVNPYEGGLEERFSPKGGFSLPFLNWWFALYRRKALSEEDRKKVEEFMKGVISIVDRFDWRGGKKKDVFRLLYEEYVEEGDRRKAGEYYTPAWLVKWCLDKAGQDYVSMPILDPCCGTGTFLDEALRRKIESGIDPDRALLSVIGFDINPLAVVLARSELFLTYRSLGGKKDLVPLVFYGDSGLWLTDRVKLLKLTGEGREDYVYPKNLLSLGQFSFEELMVLEREVEEVFKKVGAKIEKEENKKDVAYWLLSEGLQKVIEERFRVKGLRAEKIFNIGRMAEEISLFRDCTWAVSVVSSVAKYSVESKLSRGCFIATNPPWMLLTRIKGEYGKLIRSILKGYGAKGQEITGGNLSSLFLCRYGEGRGVFVMPRNAVSSGLYSPSANVSLRCLRNKPYEIYLFSSDVFKHGVLPAVVVVGKGRGEVYEVKLKRSYDKGDVVYKEVDFKLGGKDRGGCDGKVCDFSSPLGIKRIASKVRTNGMYIMGLKGGELKRGAKRYAGLILSSYDEMTGMGKLMNMREEVFMGFDFKKNRVKKLIYADRVLPFKLLSLYDVVLSEDEDKLKDFLRELAGRARNEEDKEKLFYLAKEVKQSTPEYLEKGRYYLVHRAFRVFSAVVVEPEEDNLYVASKNLCFVEFQSHDHAHYYCGVVNYLIRKVRNGFNRHIHGRALRALDFLDIHWQGLDWQVKAAELSKALHLFMQKVDVEDNRGALGVLNETKEYEELVKTIDENVDVGSLELAVKFLRTDSGGF